jgi:hypothetical protein
MACSRSQPVDARALAPVALLHQSRVAGVLAHDEAGPCLTEALHDGVGAEVPIGYPQLPGLGTVHQGLHAHSLALVRVLAGHDIAHQAQVRVVDHQAVSRQRRPSMLAQRLQSLFAARQVIAVDDAQLPSRQARLPIDLSTNRNQTLRTAAHQSSQNRRLGALELVVQRRHRHRQVRHLACGRMHRRPQSQRDQRHQLHDGREHQLPRILTLAIRLEHLIHPRSRQRLLQRHSRHHARRRMLLKSLNNGLPDLRSPDSSMESGAYSRLLNKTLKGVAFRARLRRLGDGRRGPAHACSNRTGSVDTCRL